MKVLTAKVTSSFELECRGVSLKKAPRSLYWSSKMENPLR
jgi:hypothetical protein